MLFWWWVWVCLFGWCLDAITCLFNLTMPMFLPWFDIYILLPWMQYEMRCMLRCMLEFQCYMWCDVRVWDRTRCMLGFFSIVFFFGYWFFGWAWGYRDLGYWVFLWETWCMVVVIDLGLVAWREGEEAEKKKKRERE